MFEHISEKVRAVAEKLGIQPIGITEWESELIKMTSGAMNPIHLAIYKIETNGAYHPFSDKIMLNPYSMQMMACARQDMDFVLLHEIGHWTGGLARLNRSIMNTMVNNMSVSDRQPIGLQDMMTEELTAHLIMLKLGTYLGLDTSRLACFFEAYIINWPYADTQRATDDANAGLQYIQGILENQNTQAA